MVLTSDGLTNSGAALTEASSPHPPNPGCLARPVGVSEYVYIQSPALFRNVLRIPDASAVGAKKLCQQTRQTHLPCQLPPEAEWPQQHMTSRPRDSDLRGRGVGECPASTYPCQEPGRHPSSSLPPPRQGPVLAPPLPLGVSHQPFSISPPTSTSILTSSKPASKLLCAWNPLLVPTAFRMPPSSSSSHAKPFVICLLLLQPQFLSFFLN